MKNKSFHLTTVHPRNDVRIFHNECTFLSKSGWDIELVVFDDIGDELSNGVFIKDLGAANGGRAKRILRNLSLALFYFISQSKKHRGATIHFHDPEIIFISLFLKLLGYRVIFDVHEDLPKQILSKPWIKKRWKPFFIILAKLMDKFSNISVHKIVAATDFIAEKYPSKKTITVRNLPAKEDFPIQTNRKKSSDICYIGSISEARGIFEVLDALWILNNKNGVKVNLKLGGKFSSKEVELKAINHPSWVYVDFLGWVNRNKFQEISSACSVGLIPLHPYPNYLESYPNKMFEYMACSIPIVCSDFPIWHNILKNVECALFFEPRNSKDLAKKILFMIENHELSEKMGAEGRMAFETKLNWQGEFKKLIKMYNE